MRPRKPPLPEFTGERLVPELVNPDLLNEHMARYVFAKQFATGKRVLDAGCGLGYGAAELHGAASVVGVDVSPEAISEARLRYPQFRFVEGSCEALPFEPGDFDLIVAFEVIEHLHDWRAFLSECARVLTPGGQLIVSTPNREYYAESRKHAGPNPFHVHEFDHDEFERELHAYFPAVAMLLQNHSEGVAILAADVQEEGRLAVHSTQARAADANFFVAICSTEPLAHTAAFFYLPDTGNVLRERERHIGLLESDLAATLDEHQALVNRFRALQADLEERNQWAADRHRESVERGERIVALQAEFQELEEKLRSSNAWAQSQQEKLDTLGQVHLALQQEHAKLAAWHRTSEERRDALEQQLSQQLQEAVQDLARCNALLNTAEQTVIERTQWAQELSAKVDAAAASRWVRLGRKVGVGPQL